MTDEANRYLVLVVEPGLEWKQREHQIAGVTDLQYPLLTPGPDRRTDVVHGLDSGPAPLELKTEIEVRRVDADEYIRPLMDQRVPQACAAGPQQLGRAALRGRGCH